LTFYDEFIPNFFTFQATVDIKVVGRIKGSKSNVYLGSGFGLLELEPNEKLPFINDTQHVSGLIRLATRYLVTSQSLGDDDTLSLMFPNGTAFDTAFDTNPPTTTVKPRNVQKVKG
jgi:hypothetical protein